ncbi:hypothetical protein ACA910_015771 [Epithemia clementina (nom. ined.)]
MEDLLGAAESRNLFVRVSHLEEICGFAGGQGMRLVDRVGKIEQILAQWQNMNVALGGAAEDVDDIFDSVRLFEEYFGLDGGGEALSLVDRVARLDTIFQKEMCR